jgi:hypothetical protein
VFDCALGAAARTIPDPRWRGEVVDVARRAGADQGFVGRAREVVATVAFGLRLRSLRATGGRASQAWRQGARLGAGLLLVTAWVESVAAVREDGAGVGTAVTAVALAAALAAGLAGHRLVVASATAVGLAASWAATGWDPVSSAVAVALATMEVAEAGRGARRSGAVVTGTGRPGSRWWRRTGATGLGLLGLAALIGPGDAVVGITAVAATLVVPAGLVALGGADARYAAAAAVAWGWRFLALDPGDLVDAGSALARGEGVRVALVRLVVMAWAFGLAVGLALRTERRAAL